MNVNARGTTLLVESGKPWLQCDGQQLKTLLQSSLDSVLAHLDQVQTAAYQSS